MPHLSYPILIAPLLALVNFKKRERQAGLVCSLSLSDNSERNAFNPVETRIRQQGRVVKNLKLNYLHTKLSNVMTQAAKSKILVFEKRKRVVWAIILVIFIIIIAVLVYLLHNFLRIIKDSAIFLFKQPVLQLS
jgi:hypothetical protein